MAAVNPYPTIASQAVFIASTLDNFVKQDAGKAVVVADSRELWEQASRNTQSLLVYVYFAGETPWSSNPNIAATTQRVSRKWQVFVQRGIGYQSDRGITMAQGAPSGPRPFLQVLEGIRDTIRGMLGVSEDLCIDLSAIKPVQIGKPGDGMVAYLIEFSTKNTLQNYNSLEKTQL
jgi:hypothetical protein